MSDEIWDWGFTAVDESELDTYQQLQATSETIQLKDQTVEQLEHKLDRLHNAILPLLNNLAKDPHKEYILWPKRLEKIEQFRDHLNDILSS